MLNTRLVIIDGIPGSGKSTAAQMVADSMANSNIPHRFYHELEQNHPLCIYDRKIESLESTNEALWYQSKVKDLFRSFVAERSKIDEVTIIESWLFQDHLGVAACSGMAPGLLEELADSLKEIMSPLNPAVIYYYQVDVEANWRWICDLRGPDFAQGRCGLYTDEDYKEAGITWSRIRDFACAVLEEWDTPKLIIRNEDRNWERHNRAILEFLQLE